VMVIMRKS
jgi:hypothetical protein